jgi:hypothetical protein
MTEETAIEGWTAIAKMFGIDKRSMIRRRDELLEAGIIWYGKKRVGRKCHKVVRAFPTNLKSWQIKKSAKGENV